MLRLLKLVFGTFGKSSRAKAAILAYPKVLGPGEDIRDYPEGAAIGLSAFLDHTRWIARNTETIGLRAFCRRYLTSEPFKHLTAALTFDNGFLEIFEHVAPALSEMGLPAAAMLPADLIGTFERIETQRGVDACRAIWERREELSAAFPDEGMPADCKFLMGLLVSQTRRRRFFQEFFEGVDRIGQIRRDAALSWLERLGGADSREKPAHMTWTHVNALAETGWEIGAHAGRAGRDARTIDETLSNSFRAILEKTGKPPVAAVYPDAGPDEAFARAARKIGFPCGMTRATGRADAAASLFSLPRVIVSEKSAPDAKRLARLLEKLR